MPDDLVARLKAGLDADEELAKAATQGGWQSTETAGEEPDKAVACIDHPTVPGAATVLFKADWGTLADASHIAAQDPGRTLRQVAAMRVILDLYVSAMETEVRGTGWDSGYADGEQSALKPIILKMAAIYSDDAT